MKRCVSYLAALGGYVLPFLSTLGSHVHHWSAATWSRTLAMWSPQPYHVVLPGCPVARQ